MCSKYCPNCNSFANHTESTTGNRIKTTTVTCQSCGHSKSDTEQYGVHYQNIRTESDFLTWATQYNSSSLYFEVEGNHFIYVYNKTSNYCLQRLNLQWFNKETILSICSELNIEQRQY